MSSLIEQLQADALDSSAPITDLLRKAKTAAAKLGAKDFSAWIEYELSGYPTDVEVPKYRRVRAHKKYINPVHGWQPIIGSAHGLNNYMPIAQIEALLASGDSFLTTPSSREEVLEYSKKLGFTADVHSHISRAAVAATVDAVRNTVLDWALKLEAAGVHGEGLSFSRADTERAQSVTINIGSIGNAVGVGSFGDHATVTATITAES
jgi:hypothetical protein